MAKSKPKSRRTRNVERSGAGAFRHLRFMLRHALMWLLVAGAAYWLWLDHEVARTFETHQWSLPARVYARPLELYPGAPVSRVRLMRELDLLGYQRVGAARARGQYAASAARVELVARGFSFWDIPEPERQVAVEFRNDTIAALTEPAGGRAIALMRLEPVEIGRINPRHFEDRKLIAYDELPDAFVSALIAVEDRRFLSHHGIDLVGLMRAMASNLRAMRLVQGGSTLTQQLVKNFYLTRERTVSRKLTEMMMAVSLEWRYSKKQILETYVNEVFLGQDGNRAVHGFGLAAEFYFGKPLGELDLPSMAMLIGMVKGPSVFDPRRHTQAALARRNVVLGVLARQGLLGDHSLADLRQAQLRLRRADATATPASPAFMALVQRQLLRDYSADDLKSTGLKIFTTLEVDLQENAERATREVIAQIEGETKNTKLQAAFVMVEPQSGEVLALIGDREAGFAGFNRALDMARPIGSVIKPFVYAYALDQPREYSLATLLDDRAVSWTDPQGRIWEPRNFDGEEHGTLSLLDALTRSLNLATVDLGLQLGLVEVRDYLQHLGVPGPLPAYPSLLLGAVEISPYTLAELYTAIANDGFQVPLRAISDVTDSSDRKLSRYGLKIRPVMEPATAALVRYAMMRVVARGTAQRVRRELPAAQPLAGKTGTTNGSRDSWFAGFGANRLGIAWVGRDDNGRTGLTGSSGALRLWTAAMRNAEIGALSSDLPPELVWRHVDLRRGVIVPANCTNGEDVPVHRLSELREMESCTEQMLPPTSSTGDSPSLLDRFRGLFE